MAFPERALIAHTASVHGDLTVCSFHTPPGATWGKIKPQTLKAIAEWLAKQPGTTIFGIDANCPKSDHPDRTLNVWWWDDEPTLLGPTPLHTLEDVLRAFLRTSPDLLAEITLQRPQGPLAVSHYRGRGKDKTPCRYDFIYASQDLSVRDVRYLYPEAVQAGSDHALVLASLEYPALSRP